MIKTLKRHWAWMLLLTGCAGMQRDCSGCIADNAGTNAVVLQFDMSGRPFRCWELRDVVLTSESGSDGIWWQNRAGNLVHISGQYNYVRVTSTWTDAYATLGVTSESCRTVQATVTGAAPSTGAVAPAAQPLPWELPPVR